MTEKFVNTQIFLKVFPNMTTVQNLKITQTLKLSDFILNTKYYNALKIAFTLKNDTKWK